MQGAALMCNFKDSVCADGCLPQRQGTGLHVRDETEFRLGPVLPVLAFGVQDAGERGLGWRVAVAWYAVS